MFNLILLASLGAQENCMEGHSGQKCNLIATCFPLDRIRVPFGSYLSSIRSYSHSIRSYFHSTGSYFHSTGSYFSSIRSYFHSIRSYFHSTGSYLSSIRSYFNYFVASYMTLVYSSVVFHIYPYLRGNSIPSDRNYRSAVVIIWSAVKRGRLNLDLVLVWRHTTYDYMTYNWKSSRTWSHADGVDSVYISRHILSWIKEIRIQETFKETFSKEQQMYWELF